MERKQRYSMRKVKKHWVYAMVTVAGLAVATASAPVSADTTTTDTDAKTTTTADTTDTTVVDADQKEKDQATNSDTVAVTQDTLSATDKATDTGANANQTGTATDTDKTAAATTDTTTADTTTDKAATDTAAVSDRAATDATATTDTATADAGTTAPSSDQVTAALSLSNIKKVDGKYYYYNEDGTVKKNFAITVDGQLLYFDAQTGALSSSSTYSFTNGLNLLTDGFTSHNKAYDSTQKSFETVDGYLTADSWYRPAYILEDGKEWKASSETDYRPLLMSWWPDRDTQVAYLNYMSGVLGGTTDKYSNANTQLELNVAAELIQTKIEQKITSEKSTQWLRDTISSFVTTQSRWNKDTEDVGGHLQGGALLYVNSDLTPWADSNYRLLNRTPTNQTGVHNPKYTVDTSNGGYEFLLANDIDNSNPAVQAEQLNWLHYLMNWGSIVMGDKDANFDGVRVDAVDNVDADLLQVYTNYFRSYYGVDESEAKALSHISILEAWSNNDNPYNKDTNGAALTIDNYLRLSLLYALTKPLDQRSGMNTLITNSLINRTDVTTYDDDSMPSYVFVRAHDSEVQTIIAQIIKEKINSNTDGYTFTMDELAQAFKIYNDDMNSVEKQYTHYNIPSAYALMLSNIKSVPRVYYGDLYTDDGQYMAKKSPYYDAIDTLLRARIKYASGGQHMEEFWPAGDASMANLKGNEYSTGIIASVRYGQDIMDKDDVTGSELSKTSGMVTLVGNNPKLSLYDGEVGHVKVNVGKIHAGQEFRPLLNSTENGLVSYLNDSDTTIRKTVDADGFLVFTSADIKGYATVDVNGFLAVWVPVGAADDQDIRVAASTEAYAKDALTYQATAALDSQLIFEGFSNFQDFVTQDSEYTNKRIAENADLFKAWGITSFEMAPQYVASTDHSFLDSIIANGYAFSDRYDLAMSQNNKYGSKEDLANALKALHKQGIQVIADWVPDQIYNLGGKEVVTATRVDNYGVETKNAYINDSLYVADSKSSGKDYQAQYGGAFLDELKEKYPEMFTVNMISTGVPMDPNTKIKEWKAEYMNGTNILNRGVGFVLKSEGANKYFSFNLPTAFIPKQLGDDADSAVTGFYNDGTGIVYFDTSGYRAKNGFVLYDGYYYYFGADGYMATGQQVINDKTYYFLPNGINLRDSIFEDAQGNQYYYGKQGQMAINEYQQFGEDWRYFDAKGVMARGVVTINGNTQYFDANGFQAKGKLIVDKDGKTRYFQEGDGNMSVSTWVGNDGNWYYMNAQGEAVTGEQEIDGQHLYFMPNGVQVKGKLITTDAGKVQYYDADSGQRVSNQFLELDGSWYYFDAEGNAVTGEQTIDGQQLYFDANGKQAKGVLLTDAQGHKRFYDADSGQLWTNTFFSPGNNVWYYFGADGNAVTSGIHKIGSQTLLFDDEGVQIKGQVYVYGGKTYKTDGNSGEVWTNTFGADDQGNWYYFGTDGAAVTGAQTIDGKKYYFANDGKQAKGVLVTDANGNKQYYDKDSGELAISRLVTVDGKTYYVNYAGAVVRNSRRVVNGVAYSFDNDGVATRIG
ncbi:glycoside hydrolase family 70 protein [Streptococcus sp. DD12]|uniref:glycoside hydrolase family 70 protein n=1 Tax=Streptococcus sp. DD12 TaxID=1777880 RepID=UPI0007940B1D|nr:glycoside hydrolase family 70 protein [Streptococcus sp. DD12]KXT76791.1 Glucosyltransferase GtfG [Streptococcus sp. DD12]